VAVQAAPVVIKAASGDWNGAIDAFKTQYLGMPSGSSTPDVGTLIAGYAPPVVGVAAHKIVGGWLGVNRVLARAKIPLVRL
jgi:hypothetical protein